MAILSGMARETASKCAICGVRKSGCTDYCRTHKFAVRAGARRVAEEGLIVDQAGGAWWVWDARGFVLVIGQDSKPKALAVLAVGGNVDEVDRALAGEASCDKCDGPNDRAAFANYCTRCSNEYSARHAGDPEYRPVGGR